MAYSRQASAAPAAFQITATLAQFSIGELVPASGGNVGRVTVAIRGAAIPENAIPYLEGADGQKIFGWPLQWTDATELYATFDLTGQPPGLYDLVLDRADAPAAVLHNAFAVRSRHRPAAGNERHRARGSPPRLAVPDHRRMGQHGRHRHGLAPAAAVEPGRVGLQLGPVPGIDLRQRGAIRRLQFDRPGRRAAAGRPREPDAVLAGQYVGQPLRLHAVRDRRGMEQPAAEADQLGGDRTAVPAALRGRRSGVGRHVAVVHAGHGRDVDRRGAAFGGRGHADRRCAGQPAAGRRLDAGRADAGRGLERPDDRRRAAVRADRHARRSRGRQRVGGRGDVQSGDRADDLHGRRRAA